MIVVIGAGPAGLAASLAAAQSGARVLLVDASENLGGQFWRHHSINQLDRHGSNVVNKVLEEPNIEILLSAQIWRLVRENDVTNVHVLVSGESRVIVANTLILTTGAYDRTLPFPGWDIPGVMTPGAAQSLMKSSGVIAGKKIVIAGSGPFLLSVAEGLASAGAESIVLLDANRFSRWFGNIHIAIANPSKLFQAIRYLLLLKARGVRLRRGMAVIEAHSDSQGRLESVTVAKVDRDFRVIESAKELIYCDALAVGWGFTADLSLAGNLDLAQYVGVDGGLFVKVDKRQESSVKGVFAAGEITGIGGSELALVEGHIAGLAAAGRERIPLFLFLSRHSKKRFARALMQAYSLGKKWPDWLTDDTTICRCEEVRLIDMKDAIHNLMATDVRGAKLTSRAGMGMCQGRICARSVVEIFGNESGRNPSFDDHVAFAKRPIAFPITLGTLAESSDVEYAKEKD